MSCNAYRGGLIELARAGNVNVRGDQGLRDHLRQCVRCQREFEAQVRLGEAARTLAAEAFTMPHAPEMEAALLAEFDRTFDQPHPELLPRNTEPFPRNSELLSRNTEPIPSRGTIWVREGVTMALRAAKCHEDAERRLRGINNLGRVFNGAVLKLRNRNWYIGTAIAASLLISWALWQSGKPSADPQIVTAPAKRNQELANILMPPPGGHSVPLAPKAPAPVRPHRNLRPAAALTAKAEPEQPFVAIPYTAPLAPYERTEVVRMDLPVSALIAAGFPLQAAEPGASARADLVVSEDGRARAVRLISISNSDLNRSFK
jgi:hypothetical protein